MTCARSEEGESEPCEYLGEEPPGWVYNVLKGLGQEQPQWAQETQGGNWAGMGEGRDE